MPEWPPNLFAGYAHLPLVRFGDIEKVDLPSGAIVTLPFGLWNTLDGTFPNDDRKYERTAPVFYRAQYPVEDFRDDEIEEAMKAVLHALAQDSMRLHLALLLATKARIPEPGMSVMYVKHWATGQYMRSVGPFDREAILFGDRERNQWVIDATGTTDILQALEMVNRERPLLTDHACFRALDTLRSTARPEYSLANGFALTVASLESLLNPEPEYPLGQTFARRAAALLGDATRGVDEVREFFANVYQVRNALVHGENPEPALERLHMDAPHCYYMGRSLLAEAVRRYAHWTSTGKDTDWVAFRRELDRVADDPALMNTLRSAWQSPRALT
jgi:hypothetical protein